MASKIIVDERMRGEILGRLLHTGESEGSLCHVAAAHELERLWTYYDSTENEKLEKTG